MCPSIAGSHQDFIVSVGVERESDSEDSDSNSGSVTANETPSRYYFTFVSQNIYNCTVSDQFFHFTKVK